MGGQIHRLPPLGEHSRQADQPGPAGALRSDRRQRERGTQPEGTPPRPGTVREDDRRLNLHHEGLWPRQPLHSQPLTGRLAVRRQLFKTRKNRHVLYGFFSHSQGAYVIGSGEKLELNADISNSGEDAFNAMLFLQIPRGINFIKANYSEGSDSLLCSPPTPMNNRTLQCGVGNPLPAGTDVSRLGPKY